MKLTHHISFRYIGVTILVLLVSIPLFYVVLQKVMWDNFDEGLSSQQKWITETLKTTPPENFVSFNQNIIIRPGKFNNEKPRFFTENVYLPEEEESVSFRVLEFNTSQNGKDYSVRIQKSLVESEDLLQAIAALQIAVLFVLLVALFWINRKLSSKIWTPFYKTLNTLENYKVNSGKPLELPKNSISELNDLNFSINQLTVHNLEIFNAQKEFTENASHELQTPLAILQSQLDLLWQTQPLSKEQTEIIHQLTETNGRMSRLNKSLLLMAKIDNQQFTEEKEINIQVLVEDILEKNRESFILKNIDIKVIPSSETDFVFANPSLMEILFGNLISNAFRYTPENGSIEIGINKKHITIKNSSSEGKSLEVQKLFHRFQKQNHSHKNSIGVGLEICKRICIQNKFKIQYSFSENWHQFEVLF